jgi:hypothetical protein
MALAAAAGGSGYSGQLSNNAAIRKQQLTCDPNEPMSGSTSVQYDASLVTLTNANPGPGYTLTAGFVQVQTLDGQQRFLQPLFGPNGFLASPLGRETGYVQVKYQRSTQGEPGQIAPRYTVVDTRGVQSVDTHELLFDLRPQANPGSTVYTIFATPANTFSNNEQDFLVAPDGTVLGPGQLSPARVFGNPQGQDTARPATTIAPVSPDPRRTSVNSITIAFDEPVLGFDTADLSLVNLDDGTSNNRLGPSQTLTTTDNKTFTLTNLGNLTAAAGRYTLTLNASTSGVTDANGNALQNSPVEPWTVDLTRPIVTSSSFLHTPPHRLLFDFSENVLPNLSTADLTVINLTNGVTVNPSSLTLSYNSTNNVATFGVVNNGQLADGNYQATINADGVADVAGNVMNGNVVLNFFVLRGDVNRNRRVDGTDFAILAGNFGKTGQTYATGDLSGDGKVDGSDFAVLAGNFGKSLPQPSLTSLPATIVASSTKDAVRRKLTQTALSRPKHNAPAAAALLRTTPRGDRLLLGLRRPL